MRARSTTAAWMSLLVANSFRKFFCSTSRSKLNLTIFLGESGIFSSLSRLTIGSFLLVGRFC